MSLRFPGARRILLIKPSSLGDVVHALPVLAALRKAYPAAHLAWLVSTSFAPLLAGHPLLDEVIPFDRRHYGRMLRSLHSAADFLGFCRGLRRRRFDLVIDLQGLFRSGFLAWVSGAPARVGPRAAREGGALFYSLRVDEPPPRADSRSDTGDVHAVERNLHIARALGLDVSVPAFPLALRADELVSADAKLTQAAGQPLPRFIAALPGARWASKRWPATHWAALLDALHAAGLPPTVLLGGPDERGEADAIIAATRAPLVDLVGRTSLRELTAVLARAALVVCMDSGPMHIAAALTRPLVALFGPTNPGRTGPYSDTAHVVRLALPCSPCYARRCPLGHQDCLRTLDVQRVRAAVLEQWRRAAAAFVGAS